MTPGQPLLGSPPLFWFGFIGVQIFFVISGFVIAYSAEKSNAISFFRDRMVRLGPALWICATFSLVLFLTFSAVEPLSLLKRYLKEITLYPREPWLDPVVWTLCVEIAFYAVILVLLAVKRFRWIAALAAYLACGSLALQLLMWSLGCGGPAEAATCSVLAGNRRLLEFTLLEHGCFFALGIFLWLWLVKDRDVRKLWWVYPGLIACIAQIAGDVIIEERAGARTGYSGGQLSEAIAVGIWLAAVCAIIASVRFNAKIAGIIDSHTQRAVRLIGLSTYPLYLVNYVFIGVFLWLLARAGFHLTSALWFAGAAAIALSFLIAAKLEPPLQAKLRQLLNIAGAALSLDLQVPPPKADHATHGRETPTEE